MSQQDRLREGRSAYYRGFVDGVHVIEWRFFGFAEEYQEEFPGEPGVWAFEDTFNDVYDAVKELRHLETLRDLGLASWDETVPVPGAAIAMLDYVHDVAHDHLDGDAPDVEGLMGALHELHKRSVLRKRSYVWDEFGFEVPNPPTARLCSWTEREREGQRAEGDGEDAGS